MPPEDVIAALLRRRDGISMNAVALIRALQAEIEALKK